MFPAIGFASAEELVRLLLPNTAFLWIALAAVLGIYALMSAIFLYHWRTFGFDRPAINLATSIYFIVSAALALGMVVALIFYSYAAAT